MRSSGFDPVSVEIFSKRLRWVIFILIGAFVALVMRLWLLQIAAGPTYRTQSESNRIHLQDIAPFRGMIFDRHGQLLVDNRPSFDMLIIPEDIQNRKQLVKSLEGLIGLQPGYVEDRLNGNGRQHPFKPVLIKKNLSREELAIIETNLYNLAGVLIQVKPQRHYILKEFASHLIGYLGEISEVQLNSGRYTDNKPGDLIGKYGVEKTWDKELNGMRGGEQVEVDAAGRKIKVISRKPPLPGQNIVLTIDKDLQLLAEKGLEGKKGAVVVMNPMNGEILAMASSPVFNPNVFIGGIDRSEWVKMVSSKDCPLQNRAISGLYPPGSVFKIVVALAGLEEGILDPEEEVTCNGRYTLGNHTYRCWKRYGHGKVSLHRGLVESCDVYFYKLGTRLGVDTIARYAKKCGLGRLSGFGLGSEKEGLIPTSEWKLKRWGVAWQGGETVSMAIGQSFLLVTPLQMARLISAIFNGGVLYEPKVVRLVGENGNHTYEFVPKPVDRLDVKEENLELIRKALTGVINEPHGTGSRARVKGLTVAGKTGTAQVVGLEKEKVFENGEELPPEFLDHAWFVAVAPAENPALAIAILIEHGGHGGSAAAPIAKKLIQAYLGKGSERVIEGQKLKISP
ncbi:MAG: penicillin-binding protein 2 [Deltaproteobacteria bacterium]